MNKLKRKDISNRNSFKKQELKVNILKNIQFNFCLAGNIRMKSLDKIFELTDYKSNTKINNRCVATISKKSVNKKFKLARMAFLRLARFGKICGFKKAVW